MPGFYLALPERKILKLSGADARPMLQDLVTNNLDRLETDNLVYAALLTPQGKYLFDFFISLSGDDLLIDVDGNRAAALAQRLSMYRLRRKVEIAETALEVTAFWGGDAPEGARPDPRHEALGWRLYGEALTPPAGYEAATQADYDRLRVTHLIPESGAELVPDDSYILENGFERLNGVDFRKGCYVGQEVTARMKHKTELRKGLTTIGIEGAAPIGTPILMPDGREAGTLFTQSGGRAIAQMRFDRMGEGLVAGEARIGA